ncbi:Pr6Pr family membrane protein [Flavobacterium sp.]|uniref:Pr6Pr family membrane protein n=1 Tax=Flavobacterium sp. TaxID=239 RepID=UPI0026129A49|nr:Pr6Pr family membrane protein [Flavobacterium sp.]MDD3005878.1 Pr6Pr family membrane protein [Flavobacterium sp.]
MKKTYFNILGFTICWFAIITQFVLMIQNRQAEILETIIRFFSFFTILTNILVALFFTTQVFTKNKAYLSFLNSKSSLTAITTFILVVGIVYQILLRPIWNPQGLQKIVDELLHTIIPLLVLIYWILYVKKNELQLKSIVKWLLYPLLYFIYILIRGHFSKFYPYPFSNVSELGYSQVIINFILISFFITLLLVTLIFFGNKFKKTY